MNFLAPSGTPISFTLLLKWLSTCLFSQNTIDTFAEKIKSSYNVKHCLFISSGRTGLYLILECLYKLKKASHKKEVIIPSYTCFSVPGSIEKAGLKTRVCDINPHTLDYDIDMLENFDYTNVLAIVTANLYGMPNNLPVIEKIAKSNNVYLIDDAAQCLGGKIGERYSGTFGDVGLYSLDKGKNITSIQGGMIVTNSDEIASELNGVIESLPKQSPLNLFADVIKLIIYALLLPPARYWVVTKIPFLGLGQTPYTTDYPVHRYSKIMAAMATRLFDSINDITTARRNNAENIKKSISEISGITTIEETMHSEPVYLRFPVILDNLAIRNKLIEKLNLAGIGATASYPSSVVDIEQIQHKLSADKNNALAGKLLADQIITLPTHPFTTENHIQTIKTVCEQVLTK